MAEEVKITFSGDDASLLAAAKRTQEQMDRLKATLKEAGISQAAYNQTVAAAKRAEDERVASMQKQMAAFASYQKQKAEALAAEQRAIAQQQREKMSLTDLKSAIDLTSQVLQKLKQGYDFAKEGAQLEFTAVKFDRLARSVDTTGDALLGKMREATRGTLSDMEAMAAATDILSLGLAQTEEQAIRLAAVQSGLAMDTNQMVLALTNQTTMRFDQLGLSVVGFDEKVKQLKESGMSAQEAFTEAFLQQAEAQLLKVGHAADETAGTFMRFEAGVKNLGDTMKKAAATGLEPFVQILVDANDVIQEGRSELEIYNRIMADTGGELILNRAQYNMMRDEVAQVVEQHERMNAVLEVSRDRYDKMNEVVREGATAYAMTEDEFRGLKSELDVILRGDLAKAQEDYNSKIAEYKQQLADARTEEEKREILSKIEAERDAYNERAEAIAFNIQKEAILNSDMSWEKKLEAITTLGIAYGEFDEEQARVIEGTNELVEKFAAGVISEEQFYQGMRDITTSVKDVGNVLNEPIEKMPQLADQSRLAGERAEDAAKRLGEMKTAQAELADGIFSESIPAVAGLKSAVNQLQSKSIFIDVFVRRHGGGVSLGEKVFDFYSSENQEIIGGQATGGTLGAGWTLVGEQGPELVSPTGYVYTNNQTRAILSGGLKPGRRRAVGGPVASPLLRLETEGPPPTIPIPRTPPPRRRRVSSGSDPRLGNSGGGGGGSDTGGSSNEEVAVETAAMIAGSVQAAVQQAGAANTAVINAAVQQGEKLDRTNLLLEEILAKLPGVQDTLANDLYLQSINS